MYARVAEIPLLAFLGILVPLFLVAYHRGDLVSFKERRMNNIMEPKDKQYNAFIIQHEK